MATKHLVRSDRRQELRERARKDLQEAPGYDPEADAWIYVLECDRLDKDELAYYVGMSTKLETRYRKHIVAKGDFAGHKMQSGLMVPTKDVDYDIDLLRVASFTQSGGVSRDQFLRHIRYCERQTRFEVEQETGKFCFGGT